jgi:hypothetical protein
MIRKSLLVLAMLLAMPLAGAAETAHMGKSDSLREKPFADAKVLTPLTTGQKVDILKREGAWYQVKAAGKTGWVRMLSVRRTGQAAAVSAGSLSKVATGRAGTGKIVATTGVRGLSEEALRQAAFSEEAVSAAEKYRVSAAEADRFAREGGLSRRQVPAFVIPSAPAKGENAP